MKGKIKDMRINPKVYSMAEGVEPVEVQELENGRVVEIYIMDDFENIYNEFTGQSKFNVWSSLDGQNYRLFIEKVYYEKLKDLYSIDVNRVWLEFWDECEVISNGFSRKLLVPLTLVVVIIYLIGVSVWEWPMPVCLGILLAFVIVLYFLNRFTKKKIADVNLKSIDKIKAALGEKHFQELLEMQRNYPDEFYERKYPSENEELFDDETDEVEESTDQDKE